MCTPNLIRILLLNAVLLLGSGHAAAADMWPFGPQRYERGNAAPAASVAQFAARAGAARLIVDNGDPSGGNRVSSAVIVLNGDEVVRTSDLNQGVAKVEREVVLSAENALRVELRGRPGGHLTIRVVQPSGFVELFPNWTRPDPAVSEFSVTPDRSAPGAEVLLRAVVVNLAESTPAEAVLVFAVDGAPVAQRRLGSLAPGAHLEVLQPTLLAEPGRHLITATVVVADSIVERNRSNNSRAQVVYVSGEAAPRPELLYEEIDFDALQFVEGAPARIPIRLRNPSFVPTGPVPVMALLDGVALKLSGDDIIQPGIIVNLAPGEERVLSAPWPSVSAGQHQLTLLAMLPETFPDAALRSVHSWDFIVSYAAQACQTAGPGEWSSLGPRLIGDVSGDLPPGSVGRIDAIAFDPFDRTKLFAGAPSGGVWKSSDRGLNWTPVGDGLGSLNVRSVAVDPQAPNIVYAATRNAYGGDGKGIYKSVDGGATWTQFASLASVGEVREMVIRYPSASQFVIYLASDLGVKRYLGTDPNRPASTFADWETIKSGKAIDIAVHPADDATVYASMLTSAGEYDGLWLTRNGLAETAKVVWTAKEAGLPAREGNKSLLLDLWKNDPRVLYAAVISPFGSSDVDAQPVLGIFRSTNSGDTWSLLQLYWRKELPGDLNTPFIRVNPTQPLVYFGGVKLYKQWFGHPTLPAQQIGNVHDDMKALEFDPFDPDTYWVTSDGGIWRCVSHTEIPDTCRHHNRDLRVTQFFDIEVARGAANQIAGGTQDNGTILSTGSVDWDEIKGGDGNFVVFGTSGGGLIYAQHQFLHDDYGIQLCYSGTQCRALNQDWVDANRGLPEYGPWRSWTYSGQNDAWFTADPTYPNGNVLLSQGDEVYRTADYGATWQRVGPQGSQVKGHVQRVIVQPATGTWIAGTSEGQLWMRSTADILGWTLLFEHPCLSESWGCAAEVVSLALSPKDPKVLFAVFAPNDRARDYTRVWRLKQDPAAWRTWVATNVTQNLPSTWSIRVIVGDGRDSGVAYVGTSHAGVYRWIGANVSTGSWQAYNVCLPGAVDVRDLVVGADLRLRAATFGRGAWVVDTTRP